VAGRDGEPKLASSVLDVSINWMRPALIRLRRMLGVLPGGHVLLLIGQKSGAA
jgi:hypothetical protein